MPDVSPRVCPVMVEREPEIGALERLLNEAQAAGGRAAMITGEAGAGKSRLAQEMAERAASAGFLVLIGVCTERDRDLPFAPFLDALRQELRRSGAEPVDLLGPQHALLAEVLPELRLHNAPGLNPEPLSPEQSKRRLFEAFAALFDRLAAAQPLLLLLEDLHWADPTSLELVELLPRRLRAARFLLTGTMRTDEDNEDAARSLTGLRRNRLLTEVRVEPLTKRGVARMLELLLPVPPPPAFVDTIHNRTDGNPFFVEELLATVPADHRLTGLAGESSVPRTVRDTVLRRLDGLDETTHRVAHLAAVAGAQVDVQLLIEAGDMPEERLLTALDSLLDRQILAETRLGEHAMLAFRHALTRNAIMSRLRPNERRALHRSVGTTLAQRAGVAAADLAYHLHAAGRWEEALPHALRAGDAARRMHATAEAAAHYRRALDAAQALGRPEATMLHQRYGQALALLGAFDPAREHLEAALRLARAAHDTDAEQSALYELAGLHASRDYRTAERLAEESLALSRLGHDRRRQGLALNRLGNVRTNTMRLAEGRALHEQALSIFNGMGDRWGSADCLDLIGMTRYLAGEVPEAREAFARAAAVFSELGDTERLASALTSRGLYLAVLDGPCASDAAPAAYLADAEEGLRLCHQIDWRAGEAYALVAVTCASLGEGRYDEARTAAERALAIAFEIDHQQWTVIARLTLGLLHADLLDDAGALRWFEQANETAHATGAAQWAERLDAWIARCRLRLNEPDALDALEAIVPAASLPASIGQRRALFTLAEAHLRQAHPDDALVQADRLLSGASGPRPALAVLLRARCLAALGRLEEADAALGDAGRLARAFGPRSAVWQVAAAHSTLWRGRDPNRADAEAASARTEILSLAENIGDEVARLAFLRSADARPWAPPERRTRTEMARGPGGLTPREREVAVLVAQGLSNKEIARSLVLSQKTVEMHVSNCLGKLGVAARAQLAAWAVGHGLTAPPTQG